MTSDGRRLLVISPVRDEAAHIERVVRSVAAQIRPPDEWVVVDDGSTDGTSELLRALAPDVGFMRVLATPPGYTAVDGDRHSAGASPRAFNWALRAVDHRRFTHLANLDGDIELPPDYFARLLDEFVADPTLGICGGTLVERSGSVWRPVHASPEHVRGALKLYRRECFDAIGGIQERLGWDGIDQTYARMRGYRTRSVEDLLARHHRPCGTAYGGLRGRVRGGENYYALGYTPAWALLKAVALGRARPYVVSGAAFLYGYLRGATCGSVPRVEDPEFRRFVRSDQRRRLRRPRAEVRTRLLRS